MTRTAIIAAMSGELKPLVRGWQHERRNGVDLWRSDGCIAACAGAGVSAAAQAFTEAEKLGPIDKVISTGWAGALTEALEPGQAYRVSGVIDARTGERFETANVLSHPSRINKDAARVVHPIGALKGHGFSRVVKAQNTDAALAAEGMPLGNETIPQGLKPCPFKTSGFPADSNAVLVQNTCLAAPVQSDYWLVTSFQVANAHEKQRLASTTPASLVDMEAAAIARLAAARGIPFYCVKGVSDGYRDQLPDFNRFIPSAGRFQLARFVLFVLPRPCYWPALARMGENSKKAARAIAVSLLDLLAALRPD